jgi:hypothetical protein
VKVIAALAVALGGATGSPARFEAINVKAVEAAG